VQEAVEIESLEPRSSDQSGEDSKTLPQERKRGKEGRKEGRKEGEGEGGREGGRKGRWARGREAISGRLLFAEV
jgi:hypothetical protein